jgi:hypothetical protein
MPRRSRQGELEAIRTKLVDLLVNFKKELQSSNLRAKVQTLIPAYHLLRDLGSSLIPREQAASARNRILFYLRKYPRTIVKGDELMVVAGIGDWPRRVRELRVEFGWSIVNGVTAKEMHSEGEFPLESIDASTLGPDDYILLDSNEDREAAHRWNMANEIRRQKLNVRDKILAFLRRNVGRPVTGEELRYVASNRSEWARRVRELRTELGWPVVTKNTGRPDLSIGAYVLELDRQGPAHDRAIPDSVRREVLRRDNYRCGKCGWHHKLWNPSDPRHLELHHVTHHSKGGENVAENLKTLCNICHDEIHRRH